MEVDLANQVLEIAIAIQQIPAPTCSEGQRAEYVRDLFLDEGLADVAMDALGNVFGRWPGKAPAGSPTARPLVVSAHSDTVFPASVDLNVIRRGERIYGPGIGDNALGVAGLLGLLWGLRRQQIALPGDLWLVANVCEEGLGDLRGMRAVVDRFGDQPLAYVVLEGMALGQIYNRGLGVRRYRITVHTEGGHSWVDHGRPSAIHEIASLINRLAAISLAVQPRTTLNVGKISGGTSVNTIAAQADLELDLRSEGVYSLNDLTDQVMGIVREANRPGVQVDAALIGSRPVGGIPTSHPLIRLAKRCLESQGIEARMGIGSTDANIPLSQGLPAVCIGLTVGSGSHTVEEYVETSYLSMGLAQVVNLVKEAYSELH